MPDDASIPAYEIELGDPRISECECCGGLSIRLTRFVYRNRDAFAVYYATYSSNHPNNELAMLVSLGGWGEEGVPPDRVAFYCRVRPTEDSYEVSLGDAASSQWQQADVMGRQLSREQALNHTWRTTAFEVLDEGFQRDPSLRGFVHRAHCGSAAVPLERSFELPDDVYALGDQRAARVEVGRRFVVLDGARFFVRCLLPIPVEKYDSWCVGLWVEVARRDFDRLRSVWEEREPYARFRCSGMVANDLTAPLNLPVALGTGVSIHIPNRDESPRLQAVSDGELASLLMHPWSKAEFEEYAVARGFL